MYYACITIALQIRDVPEEVRDVFADQAAQRGQSMQAYSWNCCSARRGRSAISADSTDWPHIEP